MKKVFFILLVSFVFSGSAFATVDANIEGDGSQDEEIIDLNYNKTLTLKQLTQEVKKLNKKVMELDLYTQFLDDEIEDRENEIKELKQELEKKK